MAKGIAYFGGVRARGLEMIWVAVGPKGVVAADFAVEKEAFVARLRGRGFHPQEDSRKVAALLTQVRKYTGGSVKTLKTKIDWSVVGEFPRKVLQETVRIAPGKTRSYGEVAARIGRPGAARAVGNALANNPFPLWVPCHRVVRSDGSIGGFGSSVTEGPKRKRFLLELEGARPTS